MGVGVRVLRAADRAWRTFATVVLCFGTFFAGSLLLMPLAAPLLLAAPRSARRARFGKRLVRASFRAFVGWMRVLGVLDLDLDPDTRDALSGARGLFVVANHPTLIDFVVLASLLPQADCLVKSSLTRHKAMRWPVLLAGYVSNDRGERTLEECRRSLAEGNAMVVFPEGTRTLRGRLPEFRRGAAQLAVRCSGAVLPVALESRESNLEKGGSWWLAPERRLRLSVRVLPKVATGPFLEGAGGEPGRAARDLTAALERRFHEVLKRG